MPTLWFQVLTFLSLERRLDISPTSGGSGEHCSSSAVGHVLCAPPGRVAQPRLLVKYQGNPAGAANRGRLLFGYFFSGEARKSDLPPGNPRQSMRPAIHGSTSSPRTASSVGLPPTVLMLILISENPRGHRNVPTLRTSGMEWINQNVR